MQLRVKNICKQLDNLESVTDEYPRREWRLAKTAEERKLIEIFGDPDRMTDIQRIDVSTASMEHMSAWHASWEEIQMPLFVERRITMKKASTMRFLYLDLLRSPIVKNIKWSNLQNVAYHKAIDTKRELSRKFGLYQDTGVGVYSRVDIWFIYKLVNTLNKYIRIYLDLKTAISVEILRVLPGKYIDRYIMEFL